MNGYKNLSFDLVGDLQKIEKYRNDVENLVELIRRARKDGVWNRKGLQFFGVDVDQLLDEKINNDEIETQLKPYDCKYVN